MKIYDLSQKGKRLFLYGHLETCGTHVPWIKETRMTHSLPEVSRHAESARGVRPFRPNREECSLMFSQVRCSCLHSIIVQSQQQRP